MGKNGLIENSAYCVCSLQGETNKPIQRKGKKGKELKNPCAVVQNWGFQLFPVSCRNIFTTKPTPFLKHLVGLSNFLSPPSSGPVWVWQLKHQSSWQGQDKFSGSPCPEREEKREVKLTAESKTPAFYLLAWIAHHGVLAIKKGKVAPNRI